MKTKSILLSGLMAFLMTVFCNKIDDWDEALLEINFKGTTMSSELENFKYDVDINGPTGQSLKSYKGQSLNTNNVILVPVAIGDGYTISVTAFLGEEPYAEGKEDDIEIKAGRNYVNISLSVINGVATPKANPGTGTYVVGQKITLGCATKDAVISYTLDGSDPAIFGKEYTSPILLDTPGVITLKAIAVNPPLKPSLILEEVYTVRDVFDINQEITIPGTYVLRKDGIFVLESSISSGDILNVKGIYLEELTLVGGGGGGGGGSKWDTHANSTGGGGGGSGYQVVIQNQTLMFLSCQIIIGNGGNAGNGSGGTQANGSNGGNGQSSVFNIDSADIYTAFGGNGGVGGGYNGTGGVGGIGRFNGGNGKVVVPGLGGSQGRGAAGGGGGHLSQGNNGVDAVINTPGGLGLDFNNGNNGSQGANGGQGNGGSGPGGGGGGGSGEGYQGTGFIGGRGGNGYCKIVGKIMVGD